METEFSENTIGSISLDDETAKSMAAAEVIRDSIADKVNNILWLDKLVAEENAYHERISKSHKTDEKCMVCTLPYGSCVHTRQWIKETYTANQNKLFDQSLDQSIDDMLNVMGEFNIETAPVMEDVDLSQMQWNLLEQSPVDKIGATNVALYSPDERGWHSCVKLDTHILVYGGFKYRNNKQVPSPLATIPITSHPEEEDVEYLTDIRVYDTQGLAWYGVRNPGDEDNEINESANADATHGPKKNKKHTVFQPEGRYGHMAAALDNNRMLVFGGKGKKGHVYGDTWIYYRDVNQWQLIRNNEMKQLPVPAPRYFGACVSVQIPEPSLCRTTSFSNLKEGDKDVYLFGGTNGDYNFGDLWVFRGSKSVLRWERLAAVGTAPCPRYGHQMLLLNEGQQDRFNQQLMVLGGCYVNPQGRIIESSLGKGDLYNLAASPTAEILRAEASTSTGIAEYDMVAAYKTSVTPVITTLSSLSSITSGSIDHNTVQKKKKDKLMRHATTLLDAYVLNVGELIWRSQIYPKVSGSIPSARLHFSAACLGKQVFVMGGCQPISFEKQLVEENTTVYVCDSDTMRWSVIDPINSNDHLKEPLRIAQADVIRAVRRCDEEKLRGISLGALNGRTIELAEAQAVLEVCKWRLQMLQTEQVEQSVAPPGRWGASLTPQGQRMMFIGGWEAERPVPKDKSVVLNVEQEHERRRRLDDEYSARLHKDRIREQAELNMANAQSVFELRAIKEAELNAMNRDLRDMAREDILSALPPLFKPDCVQLVKANQHTIWVKWPRLVRNSSRALIDPETITYYLYMRCAFENLCVNDRVFVTVPASIPTVGGKKGKKRQLNMRKNALLMAYDSKEVYFDDQCKRYPAEITKVSGDGKFDVVFDDGTGEKNVQRHRLKLAPPLDLSLVPLNNSRPTTADASLSRPGTADSVHSNNSQNGAPATKTAKTSVVATQSTAVTSARPVTITATTPMNNNIIRNKKNEKNEKNEKNRLNSPGRSRSRPATAETTARAAVNAALLQASVLSIQQDPIANKAVVPLEFAQSTRNRLLNRINRKNRALQQSDQVFRGVVPPTVAELEAQSRAEKRLLSSQLRAEKALEKEKGQNNNNPKGRFNQSFSSYNSGAVSALTSPTNFSVYDNNSPYSNNNNNNSQSTQKLKRQMSNVTFDDTNPEDPFSFINDDIQYYNDNNNLVKDYNTGEEYYNHTRGNNNSVHSVHSVHDTPRYTVQVDGRWKLVYVGNECEYNCTNLVSDAVLLQEPDITVPVAFAYQVHGADVPFYERSQLSTTVIFHTLPPSHFTAKEVPSNAVTVRKEQHNAALTNSAAGGNHNSKTGNKNTNNTTNITNNNKTSGAGKETGKHMVVSKNVNATAVESALDNAAATTGSGPSMSRTKKDIISAVVSGQQMIQIERLNNFCQSHGVAEDYL